METEISVAPATLADMESLAPMFDAYRRFYKAESDLQGAVHFLTERISRNESRIFIAYRIAGTTRVAAGFTQLYPSFSSVSMKRLWILNDLFVKPESRKSGIGAALMAKARDFAKADGAKGLSLATQTENAAAQALYLKMGYVKDTQFHHFHHTF
jgi:GNAT superfamily N-acetyltransferase